MPEEHRLMNEGSGENLHKPRFRPFCDALISSSSSLRDLRPTCKHASLRSLKELMLSGFTPRWYKAFGARSWGLSDSKSSSAASPGGLN